MHKVTVITVLQYYFQFWTGFYQRVSTASYASAGIARAEMSVRPSVTLWYYIKTKKTSVMISTPSESLNILVSAHIWFITKCMSEITNYHIPAMPAQTAAAASTAAVTAAAC